MLKLVVERNKVQHHCFCCPCHQITDKDAFKSTKYCGKILNLAVFGMLQIGFSFPGRKNESNLYEQQKQCLPSMEKIKYRNWNSTPIIPK